MKRCLLFCFCIMMLMGNDAFSQKKEYSHWSLGLKGGVNRSEFSGGGIFSDAEYGFSLGAELEWTANPFWGIAVDYEYIDYSCFDIDAAAHEIGLVGSINFTNLLAKHRRGGWQKFNAYGRLGGALSFYDAVSSATTLVIPMGAALEYNVSKHLAVGLTGERRWHTSSTMGLGRVVQDRAINWSLLANVRVKFGSNHIRDARAIDYERAQMAIGSKNDASNGYDDASIRKNVSNNEDAINQLRDELNKTNADVKKLNEDLEKTSKELDEAKDDLTRYYKESPEDYYYSAPSDKVTSVEAKNIEFEFGSTAIKSSSYGELDGIVESLKADPALNLEIIGHTDAIGTAEANRMISLDRANTVKKYLVEKGIDSKRIITQGVGYDRPVGNNATAEGRQKNRRVEFVFSNK